RRGRRRYPAFPRLRHGDPGCPRRGVRRLRRGDRGGIPGRGPQVDLPAQAPAVPGVAARSRTDLPQRLLPSPAGGPRPREPPQDPLPRLAQALQAEDRLEHRLDDDRLAVHVAAVAAAAVEAVLIAALEALAEVVRVVGPADVAAA